MSYYKTVDGVRVDGALYDAAPDEWTLRNVIGFLGELVDAEKYTPTEYATLELVAKRPGTPAARAWLRAFLKSYNPGDWQKPKKVKKKAAKKKAAKKTATKKGAKKSGAKKKTAKKKAAKNKAKKKGAKKTGSKKRGKNGRQQVIPGT